MKNQKAQFDGSHKSALAMPESSLAEEIAALPDIGSGMTPAERDLAIEKLGNANLLQSVKKESKLANAEEASAHVF